MPDTDYPYLRDALDDRFSGLTDAELDSVFASAFGDDVSPLEYEEFFSDLGKSFANFAQQAAPIAATALQGGLEGGTKGMKYGPYGALVGALAGGTGAALQKHTTGPGRDVGSVLTGVVNFAGGGGLGGMPGGPGQPSGPPPGPPTALPGAAARPQATDQLMRLLATPELGQALAALIRGRNTAIPAGPGGTPVPANAYAGLLSALARESEAEALGWDEAVVVPAYLVGPDGRLVADPNDPDQRSGRLLQLLSAQSREQDEAVGDGIGTVVFPEDYPEAYDEAFDEYDDVVG